MHGAAWVLGGLLAVSNLFGGCVYDADDRCGENQILEDDVCKCVEGAALVDNKCELCGDNEVPGEGECVCDEGFARTGAGTCEKGEEGIGEECSDDSDCNPDGADTCVTDDAGSYCTVTGCESAADCPLPYGCETDADEPYCARAPSGLDEPCESSDECSEFEANYCETMIENKCKVECLDDPGTCHGDWVCCDYSALIGAALCVSSSDLEGGSCPFGGVLVEAE